MGEPGLPCGGSCPRGCSADPTCRRLTGGPNVSSAGGPRPWELWSPGPHVRRLGHPHEQLLCVKRSWACFVVEVWSLKTFISLCHLSSVYPSINTYLPIHPSISIIHLSIYVYHLFIYLSHLSAAAKSLQSCPTLCYPIDGSPPGSAVPSIYKHLSVHPSLYFYHPSICLSMSIIYLSIYSICLSIYKHLSAHPSLYS